MKYLKYFFYIIIFFTTPLFSQAATLGISPSTGTYKIGDTFTVYLVVSSHGQAINAVSETISFPTSLLRVVSVAKTNSIINYWVQEPTFSNASGSVSSEGVIINPGYIGTDGKVLRIVFEAKAGGVAEIGYTLSSVLANDGLGTNVLTSTSKASFTIGQTSPISTTPGASATPAPIFVSSSTHPDPNEWYSFSNLELQWKIPNIVDALSYELDQTVSTNPGVIAKQKVSKYVQNNLNDGTWFFHLRAKNESGWGAVSHFRIQVDTKAPQYVNILNKGEREGKTIFNFSSKDETSGIKKYEIRIDGGEPVEIPGADNASYAAPILVTGKHIIFVTAYDFAGNSVANSLEFNSIGLVPPKLIEYPNELKHRELLKVTGISSPNHDIILTLVRQSQKKGISEEIYYFSGNSKVNLPVEKKLIKTNSDGVFRYTWEKKLLAGTYRIYAVAVDREGNESLPSEQISFEVLETNFVKILTYLTGILSVVVPFVGILLFTIIMLMYARRKYRNLKIEMYEELEKTEQEVEESLKKAEETTIMLENVHHIGPRPKSETIVLEEHEKDIKRVEKSIRQRILNLRKKLTGK